MIFSQEVFELEDSIFDLAQSIVTSQTAQDYLISKKNMEEDNETSVKVKNFVLAKEEFEKIEAYGKYAPDFQEKRRKVRLEKRVLDMDEKVATYRYHETLLQDLLDHITFDVAMSVSKDIKISAGNPFFEMAQKGCGGNCHVG